RLVCGCRGSASGRGAYAVAMGDRYRDTIPRCARTPRESPESARRDGHGRSTVPVGGRSQLIADAQPLTGSAVVESVDLRRRGAFLAEVGRPHALDLEIAGALVPGDDPLQPQFNGLLLELDTQRGIHFGCQRPRHLRVARDR